MKLDALQLRMRQLRAKVQRALTSPKTSDESAEYAQDFLKRLERIQVKLDDLQKFKKENL